MDSDGPDIMLLVKSVIEGPMSSYYTNTMSRTAYRRLRRGSDDKQ